VEPVKQIPTVGQTQAAAAAVIADTVGELTRRAIDPALNPFLNKLDDSAERWEDCTVRIEDSARSLTDHARDLADHAQRVQSGQQELSGNQLEIRARLDSAAAILRELAAASREQGALLDAARTRDTTLADRLQAFQDLNTRQLAQLDAERAHLVTTVRGALDTERASLATTLKAQHAHLASILRTTRLIVILGLVILFAETLALALVILHHG
jgi:hypothetical protein